MCEVSLYNIKVSKKDFIVEAKILFVLAIQRYLKEKHVRTLVIVAVVERKGEGDHGVLGGGKKSYIIRGLE